MKSANVAPNLAPGLEDTFELPPEEILGARLSVRGELPFPLRGRWLMNGPGRFQVGQRRYSHWLDGDGVVAMVHFDGSASPRLVRKFVRSRKWAEEERFGEAQFRTFGTSWTGDRLLRGIGLESPVNVSVYPFSGTLLAFGEQGLPWALDPATLETVGEHTFGGALNEISPFSAHPHFDPISGEMVAFGMSFAAREPTIQLYRFAADGSLLMRSRIPAGLPASIHDFAISPTYAVFWVSPYVLDFGVVRSGGSILDALEWKPELGSRLLVVRREDGQLIAEVPVGHGYCLHTINAHEPAAGRLVIDVLELDEPVYPHYLLETLLADVPNGRPVRLEIDLLASRVVERRVLPYELAPDFPAIDPANVGRANDRVWLLGMSQAGQSGRKFFDTLACLSWAQPEQGDWWRAPAGSYLAGEPVFVGRDADAAPGKVEAVILCPLYDAVAKTTRLLVFNADHIAGGPLAELDFEVALAPGFHACWAQDSAFECGESSS